jgi:hypothetical protein
VRFPSPFAEFRLVRASRELWRGVEPERRARIIESVKKGEAVADPHDAELAVALAGFWRDRTRVRSLGERAAQAEEANRGLLWVNLYGSADGTRKAA